ncbi:hypothetical protein B296_00008298 [Ensete ventricosum]|uniref:Uncharacterized protein n=1 Tax=Ensete ventricosum TaxID=4639 RepID=A0A426YL09_ENSVE|nr:hypothetical protein B296_00008298 [Ensete ventricosum]
MWNHSRKYHDGEERDNGSRWQQGPVSGGCVRLRARLRQWRRHTEMKKRRRRGCPASGGCDCCHYRWRTGNEGNVDGAIGEVAKEAGEGRGSSDNNKGCSRRGGLLAADGGTVDAIGQREAVTTIEVLVTAPFIGAAEAEAEGEEHASERSVSDCGGDEDPNGEHRGRPAAQPKMNRTGSTRLRNPRTYHSHATVAFLTARPPPLRARAFTHYS